MSKKVPEPPRRKRRFAHWVMVLSCLNLACLCAVSYLIYNVSETWWVGTVLTYAPRSPFAVPSILLLVASLFVSVEVLGINLVSTAIAAIPIMGLSLPLEIWANGNERVEGETTIKLVSCNVQAFKPDFSKVLEEIAAISPDIVALQEAANGDPRLDRHFADWHSVHHGHYWVGSRYPVKLITDCDVEQFGNRTAGLIVEIETPGGAIVISDIHQMTARFGLKELNRNTLINLDGTKELESYEIERYLEARDLREIVNKSRHSLPLIVCGDFNTPTCSSLFQRNWGDLQSAFDIAGLGYGYTSPCKGNRAWPDNLPWARIDHILCSNEFTIRKCEIGTSDGSDHRLITATIGLKPTRPTPVVVDAH